MAWAQPPASETLAQSTDGRAWSVLSVVAIYHTSGFWFQIAYRAANVSMPQWWREGAHQRCSGGRSDHWNVME